MGAQEQHRNTVGQRITMGRALEHARKIENAVFMFEGEPAWMAHDVHEALGEYAYSSLDSMEGTIGSSASTRRYVLPVSRKHYDKIPQERWTEQMHSPYGVRVMLLREGAVAAIVKRRLCLERWSLGNSLPEEPPGRLAPALTLAEKIRQRGQDRFAPKGSEPPTPAQRERDDDEAEIVQIARTIAACNAIRGDVSARLNDARTEAIAAIEEWREAVKHERETRQAVERLSERSSTPVRASEVLVAMDGLLTAHARHQRAASETINAGGRVREAHAALTEALTSRRQTESRHRDALEQMRKLVA